MTLFGTNQGASTIISKAFYWERSSISMFEMETLAQSCTKETRKSSV
jgi:hypothetical protein